MPVREGAEGVGAHKQEKPSLGRQGCSQRGERVDGEVGSRAGRFRSIGKGELEARLAGDGQAGHGDAVLKAGRGTGGLERLQADGSEKNPIKFESPPGGAGDGHMAEMRRIEAASEEGDALAVGGGWDPGDMVT